ncbi:MAG: aldehyde dehydrogenase family protein [Ostreibacterium sp.]
MLQTEYDKYGLYINGKWVKGRAEESIVIDPSNEEVLGRITTADDKQAEAAIDAASQALTTWQQFTTWERSGMIARIGTLLKERTDEIARVISLETGKPLAQAKREVALSYDQFIWFSEQTKRIKGEVITSRLPNVKSYVEYEPVGICAAFASWNFPLLLLARKLAPALAAGCPMIVRPTELAPLTSMLVLQCCHEVTCLLAWLHCCVDRQAVLRRF